MNCDMNNDRSYLRSYIGYLLLRLSICLCKSLRLLYVIAIVRIIFLIILALTRALNDYDIYLYIMVLSSAYLWRLI